MAKDEVIKRLENSWEMLSDRIDQAHKEFLKNAKEEDLAKEYLICWEEADVPFQLGRFFYPEEDDGRYEFHLEMHLTPNNFKGYTFSDNGNLAKVQHKLGKKVDIDFLVEDREDELLSVCGEAKYFRYKIEGTTRGRTTLLEAIEEDYERLRTFSQYKICSHTAYAVLDKYYHRSDPKLWNKAKSLLKEMEESGITVFVKEV